MASRSRANIRLDEAVEKYIQRITNEGQAERSIYTAKMALSRFKKTVATKREPNPWVHTLTAEIMDDYCYGPNGLRAGTTGKPIQAISFNRYRSVLVQFFEYAGTMRWTDLNPMATIPPARPDMPKTRLLLSPSELISLLDVCNNPVERIANALGMNTALRANDVKRLTVFDANLANSMIQTEIRKTKKLDVKPITMDLHRELVRWLDEYARLTGFQSRHDLPNDFLLMPSYRLRAPREMIPDAIVVKPYQVHTHPWRLVQRPLKAIGYPTKGEGFHTLRRSSARAFFESLRETGEGRDHALMIVKDFLNHSSVTITEQYLGLTQERAIRDVLLKDKPFLSGLASKEQAKLETGVELYGSRTSDALRQGSEG